MSDNASGRIVAGFQQQSWYLVGSGTERSKSSRRVFIQLATAVFVDFSRTPWFQRSAACLALLRFNRLTL